MERWSWSTILATALILLLSCHLSSRQGTGEGCGVEEKGEECEVREGGGRCVRCRREEVTNWAGTVRLGEVEVHYPTTVEGVQGVVRLARRRGVGVRAIGARHSWSSHLLHTSPSTLLLSLLPPFSEEVGELTRVGAVEVVEGRAEVEVGAGATLGHMGEVCEEAGWQVASAPAHPGVTLAGAVVSLSHGAGAYR